MPPEKIVATAINRREKRFFKRGVGERRCFSKVIVVCA